MQACTSYVVSFRLVMCGGAAAANAARLRRARLENCILMVGDSVLEFGLCFGQNDEDGY